MVDLPRSKNLRNFFFVLFAPCRVRLFFDVFFCSFAVFCVTSSVSFTGFYIEDEPKWWPFWNKECKECTVQPRFTTTRLIRPPIYYDHFLMARTKAHTFSYLKTPLLRPRTTFWSPQSLFSLQNYPVNTTG